MTIMRIARVPYLNSVPFFSGLALDERFELVDCVPKQMAQQAQNGDFAAGPMPLAAYLKQQNIYERLGHFGIAVRGRAHSALLFSRLPLRQLQGATIALTQESMTTARLLQVLLEQRYHLQPRYVEAPHPEADAVLLIGDDALRLRGRHSAYPFETDMGFEWWLWQHLPCVFAVWVVRRDLAPPDKKRIEAAVARALAMNTGQWAALAKTCAPKVGLSEEEMKVYFESFVYRFGPQEEEAIEKMQEYFTDALCRVD